MLITSSKKQYFDAFFVHFVVISSFHLDKKNQGGKIWRQFTFKNHLNYELSLSKLKKDSWWPVMVEEGGGGGRREGEMSRKNGGGQRWTINTYI